jgi:DNA-binding transcriptional LysR family regulator
MASPATAMAISVRVAERGSFASAAVDAGVPPPAVANRQVEARLGARFIKRTTRRLALTT